MTAGTAQPEVTTGYTLVLPPGWARIPVRSGTGQAIRRILDDKVRMLPAKVPRDAVAPYRVKVEGHLRTLAAEARKHGGLDLYLPVDLRNGSLLAASFVISEGSLTAPDGGPAPDALLRTLADEDGEAAPVGVDGAAALRTERAVGADTSRGIEHGSRRVDYVMPVPGDSSRWLLAIFSTVISSQERDWFAMLLVELFDAIMSTFRWTTTDSSDIIT